VRTLLAYVGDNPDREGLLDTPKRFVNAYEELFAGYKASPARSSTARSRKSTPMTTSCWCAIFRSIPIASIT